MSIPKKIDEEFALALESRIFPGAAFAVGKEKKILVKKIYGLSEWIPLERKLSLKTYFDLASLAKPLCTTFIAMLLNEKGLLPLDTPVSKFFSKWKKEPYAGIQIKHLLQHTSGLPAWKPYFEDLLPKAVVGGKWGEVEKGLIEKVLRETLENPIGQLRVYSDLGFILFGKIIEQIAQKPLDRLFTEWIAKPLKLENTFFIRNSAKGKKLSRTEFAATRKCSIRRKFISGEVDDPHAWILDGVAGHAGLFSTLEDLIRITDEILKIDADKSKLLKKETFRRFVDGRPPLGWDTPTIEESQAGSYFSKDSIGHLGFTGTSLWIDLSKKFYVILLTNRVHPYGRNEAIKEFRSKIHNLALKSLRLVK